MKHNRIKLFFLALLACIGSDASVATQRLYLSGTGSDDIKTWEFYCTKGQNSGKWSTIQVPSQWELQGFGDYTYGRFYLNKEARPSDEVGLYRYTFTVPADWKGEVVDIVFEGSMTDTEVKINGKSAGPVHQGAFTEFSYNISDKLHYGKENELEVKVSKESADPSVNKAERRADWWLFGGIYRPVYLTARPKTHIERVGIDARADGTLNTTIHTKGVKKGQTVEVSLTSVADGVKVGEKRVPLACDSTLFTTKWDGVKTWDPEHPNLYDVSFISMSFRDGMENTIPSQA